MTKLRAFTADQLSVEVYADRRSMGRAAADAAAMELIRLIDERGDVSVLFAAAPSQGEFLDALASHPGIDWSRVVAFQLDEYVGLADGASESFGSFLRTAIFDRVQPGRVEFIGATRDVEEARKRCDDYAALLQRHSPDIVFLGIGENGHLAFNDPPVADFADPAVVKVVELDLACRQQQVNDACFPTLNEVPTHAITLTIPTLLSGRRLFCVVPGPAKRAAVSATLTGPISTDCPASILRTVPHCTLYLDPASYGED
jgi:glucosamine-6-phosphate deaminase